MKKDTILKEITKEAIRDVLKYIVKIEIDDFEFLDIEFQKIESRKADILIKAKNKILHIEFQTTNDKEMLYRQMRYFIEIKRQYPKYEIYQYIIYIGEAKLNMINKLKNHNITFKYDIIDMKKLDCQNFMDINTPQALVIAVLCDFKDKNPNQVIKEILSRLLQITKNENEFRKYILMLEELSTSRKKLKNIIKEEEMALQHLTWEDLPSYEVGYERAILYEKDKWEKQGKIEEKLEVIKNGIQNGIDTQTLILLTKLSEKEINKIKEEL